MVVIKASEVKSYISPLPYRRELKVLLSPKIHKTSNLIGMGMVIVQPGEAGNPHIHQTEQEIWFVISGSGQLVIGGEVVQLEPELVIVAPPGVPHQIMNKGKDILKALFIFTPAGPEQPHNLEIVENAISADHQ